MDEGIGSLEEAKIFCTLAGISGYMQNEMDQKEGDKKTTVSHRELYRYTRMLFRLKNALALFQRSTNVVLSTVNWYYALIRNDDTIVFSETFGDHLQIIQEVLEIQYNAGVILKLKKLFSFSCEIDYLGHVTAPSKLQVATMTTKSIAALRYSPTVSDC